MTFDLDKIRAETPGLQEATHLLAAGSALMPQAVINAVTEFTELEGRLGGYEAFAARSEQLNGVYDAVAALVNAGRDEIALLPNATVAWCAAFYALPLQKGQRILTGLAEYAANYVAFLQRAKRDGVTIEVVPNDASGALDLAALETMIGDDVGLIALTWVPTNGGLVNPAQAVGQVAQKHSIPYLLDACQAVGQMPVDVQALHCDFLSATGRKFLRGPRGTGFLYVNRKWLGEGGLEPAMIDHFAAPWTPPDGYTLRPDARRFETWENSYALRAGLGVAAAYATALGMETIRDRAWGLAARLREGLNNVQKARVHDLGAEKSAIVSFSVEGLEPEATVAALKAEGIVIGPSYPDNAVLDSRARDLPILMRAAPHYYNTEAEVDRLVEVLSRLAPN